MTPGTDLLTSFWKTIEPLSDAYYDAEVAFLALIIKDEWHVVRSRISLQVLPSETKPLRLLTNGVSAGRYRLSELKISIQKLVDSAAKGQLLTPYGELPVGRNPYMLPSQPTLALERHRRDQWNYQNRLTVLSITGGGLTDTHELDWELRAAPIPFDGLADLMQELALPGSAALEVYAPSVAAVDATSTVSGQTAQIKVLLSKRLRPELVTVGYRVLIQGGVRERVFLSADDFAWGTSDRIDAHLGTTEIAIPEAAIVHCLASYKGIAENHYYLVDPQNAQNPLLTVYSAEDEELTQLKELLTPTSKRANSNDFERAVSWLMWIRGFSPAHLSLSSKKMSDNVDLLVSTPSQKLLLVECTTGRPSDDKLQKLAERVHRTRAQLRSSGNGHLSLIGLVAVSRSDEELHLERKAATDKGLVLISADDMQGWLDGARVGPDADALFQQISDRVGQGASQR